MTTYEFVQELTTQDAQALASLPKIAREGAPATLPDGLNARTLQVVIAALHYGVVETVEMRTDHGVAIGVALTPTGERRLEEVLG